MGGNVADFRIVQDSSFRLAADDGDDRQFTFSLVGAALRNQGSILSFMVVGNARLDVEINGHIVIDGMRLGSVDVVRCVQEVCPPNIFERVGDNLITFEAKEGSCSISDVVIWFQRSV